MHNVGEATGFVALLFTNVLHIRLMMVVSSLIFMVTGLSVGLEAMAIWTLFYLIANGTQIGLLLYAKRSRHFSDEEREVYRRDFSNMTPSEFTYVYHLGTHETLPAGELLQQGQKVTQLRLLTKGEVIIRQNGQTITNLTAYHFIGEMSFLSDGQASTDVYNETPIECHTWQKKTIQKLQLEHPALYTKFIEDLGRDIVLKITRQYD